MMRVWPHLLILWALFLTGPQAFCLPDIPQQALIRDAEIERIIADYMTPLLRVAGINPKRLKLYIVHDDEVNAAAGLDVSLMIQTGLVAECRDVGQFLGVLAHETGHIAGRHNERLLVRNAESFVPVAASMVLGLATTVATGNPAGFLIGAVGMDAVDNSRLSFHRAHEGAADQAAFKYLEKLGWSSKGLYEFMETMRKQEMFAQDLSFAYKRTHPFSHDRMRWLENHLKTSKFSQTPYPAEFEQKFQRMKAKIAAFTKRPHLLARDYPETDGNINSLYVQAIINHRQGFTNEALVAVEKLLKREPNNAYFHELQAQIYFESGKGKQAVKPYEKAIHLLPNNGLLKIQLAHVLLETPNQDSAQKALHYLDRAQPSEKESPYLWRLYATAYGRLKDEGMMALSLAEEALLIENHQAAETFATKAAKILTPTQTSALQRAHDIKDMIKI